MSWEASTYVLTQKVGNAAKKLVLMGFANHAHADGSAAFPAIKTVAEYAECSVRSAQRHVAALVEEGWMREGDQQLVAHYAQGKRPIVYDLSMSAEQRAEWAAYNAAGANALRGAATAAGAKGAAAKAQVRTGDNLTPVEVASNSEVSRGDNLTPVADAARGDNLAGHGVTDEPVRGDTGVTQNTHLTFQGTTPLSSSATADAAADTENGDEEVDEKNDREDVRRICEHLVERIVAQDCKRPTVTKRWRDAARLMLDSDGRSEAQVHRMIEWATHDEFWRANILSMPKLREKYDQMKLRAEADYVKAQQAASTPRRGDIDWTAAMERAEQMDQSLLAFGGGASA